jgi:hypothetical protein
MGRVKINLYNLILIPRHNLNSTRDSGTLDLLTSAISKKIEMQKLKEQKKWFSQFRNDTKKTMQYQQNAVELLY